MEGETSDIGDESRKSACAKETREEPPETQLFPKETPSGPFRDPTTDQNSVSPGSSSHSNNESEGTWQSSPGTDAAQAEGSHR
ncbi:hypothetical protein FKM82_026791 [Ascaphus truei]